MASDGPTGVGSIYWQGADNNIYVKGPGGNDAPVKNYGKAINVGDNGFDAANFSGVAKRVADPNAPIATPGNPNANAGKGGGGGGGSSAPAFADKSNSIALNNAGLGALDGQTSASIDKINSSLATLLGNYSTQTANNKTNYTTNSNENQGQFQAGKQTSLVNAAQGRQGLMGTLASIGALSGDGITQANMAVQNGANEDLNKAGTTFANNQSGLDTAWNTYNQQDKQRQDNANKAAQNDIISAKNAAANTRQTFLTNLANDYQAEGKVAQAKSYTDQAAALYPQIASTNIPASTITPEAAAYTPASLASYLNNSNTLVSTNKATSSDPSNINNIPGLSANTKRETVSVA